MIRRLGLMVLFVCLAGCGPQGGSTVSADGAGGQEQKIYRWKLITTWPKNLPGLGTGPERLAERLRVMSQGRLDIKVYGAGELVDAFQVFDAVSQGTAGIFPRQ